MKKNKLCSNPYPDVPNNFGKPIVVDNDQVLYGGVFFKRLMTLLKDKPHKKTKARMQRTQYLQRYGNMDFTVTIERGDKLN
jgi:hypothetical protein